jgi:hypothetical protein
MADRKATASSSECPRLEDYPYTSIECALFSPSPDYTFDCSTSIFLNPVQPNLVIKCEERIWNCHKEILCPRCTFFKICCYSGFEVINAPISF